MNGDLHLHGFHALNCCYSLHYPAFIQVFHIALDWKKLDPVKTEKSYSRSSLLVVILLNQVEKRLIEECV